MLELPAVLPDSLKGKKVAAQVAALDVLASILDLIGRQLAYSQTFLDKFGNFEKSQLNVLLIIAVQVVFSSLC